MKLGVSSYCFVRAIKAGRMSVLDIFDWAAEHGAEHVEIVPAGFSLTEEPELIDAIRKKSEETGVVISNYAIGANFVQPDEAAMANELQRVKGEVDIARKLGVTRMRHDIAWRKPEEATAAQFEADLPNLIGVCQEIADYAAQYNIVTSVENHGYHVQASERVLRLVLGVNRSNFRTTVDTGNFMCADEDPVVSAPKNLPYASMVHIKDFYWRRGEWNPGEGWFPTLGGRYLRGAIFGHGDIDVTAILKAILQSGYDSFVSIEFEGMEEPEVGTLVSLNNARALLERIG